MMFQISVRLKLCVNNLFNYEYKKIYYFVYLNQVNPNTFIVASISSKAPIVLACPNPSSP